MKNRGLVFVIAVILAVFIGASGMYTAMNVFQLGNATGATERANIPASSNMSKQETEKFVKAFEMISSQFYEEIDRTVLLEGAIEGMIKKLEDPYSSYMDKETANQFTESLSSHFQGIGAEVSMTNGQVTIVAPFRDSPAEKAGLMPNDKILKIDGESIEGWSLYDAVLKIRGEKGTIVDLTIQRSGATEPVVISVERDEIPIETVKYEMMEHKNKNIGYLEITSFSADTAERFADALQELEKQGMDALIIDVRGNPGGYLNSVEDIGKYVIPSGKPIVQIENRDGEKVRKISNMKNELDYPIIGLTDRGSASASEILAAALKEAGGYDVVGETTFGKGTVQQAMKLGDGSEIKLTLFKWLTSDGNFINEVGVEPTVEVKQPDYFYLPPLNVTEDLKQDMLSEQIKNAQQMLKGLGFEPGRSDGYFSAQTEQAVRAFQNKNGLNSTGVIDGKTAAMIHERIVESIRDRQNDRQLQTALELAVKQSN